MIAGAGLNDRATVERVIEEAPAAIARLTQLGVPFNMEGAGRQPGAAPDARGRPQRAAHCPCRRRDRLGRPGRARKSGGRQSEHHADPRHGRDRPHHAAPCRGWRRRACLGRLCLQPAHRPCRGADRSCNDPCNRRRRAVLPVFDRAARKHRRRDRDGVARGRARRQHGVHAVPPDLPLQPRRQELPDYRGGARRGRAAHQSQDAAAVHAVLRRPARTRAARCGGARDRCRDQTVRARLRPPRHQPYAARFRAGALPQHLRQAAGAGHRHDRRADPGSARTALHLRRREDRPRRAHRPAGIVRGG